MMSNFLTATGIVQTFGYGREEAMTQEKLIREQIKEKVWEEMKKKVRCVFYLCQTNDNRIAYGVSGNSHNIFAIAFINETGEIELVY